MNSPKVSSTARGRRLTGDGDEISDDGKQTDAMDRSCRRGSGHHAHGRQPADTGRALCKERGKLGCFRLLCRRAGQEQGLPGQQQVQRRGGLATTKREKFLTQVGGLSRPVQKGEIGRQNAGVRIRLR